MPKVLVAPAPIEFYCEILTGIEPLTRLHLVVDDDATAEFHTPVKRVIRRAILPPLLRLSPG